MNISDLTDRELEIAEVLKDYLYQLFTRRELIEEIQCGLSGILRKWGFEENEEEDLTLEEEALSVLDYLVKDGYFLNISPKFDVWKY